FTLGSRNGSFSAMAAALKRARIESSNEYFVRVQPDVRKRFDLAKRRGLPQLYGAAVRCKRSSSIGGFAVLHQCIRSLNGACCAPDHHGNQRAYALISGQASSGPFGAPGFACAVKPILHLRLILSQTWGAWELQC